MKKKWFILMMAVVTLFVNVACSNTTKEEPDKDDKEYVKEEKEEEKEEEPVLKEDFDKQAISAIMECSHVNENINNNKFSDVSVKIKNKKIKDDKADIRCEITYSNKYSETTEVIRCSLEEWSEGWTVEEIKVEKELDVIEMPEVYFFNCYPETDSVWQELATLYEEETGVNVKVHTDTNYNLSSNDLYIELSRSDAPTMYFSRDTIISEIYEDYCYDISNADVMKELVYDGFSYMADEKIYGIPLFVETYGIIVNKTLLKKAGYSVSDITSFNDLKRISEDITKRSSELGFSAFTSYELDSYESWRFTSHLANLPVYFENKAGANNKMDVIQGTYLNNYRKIFDLYINNSTCSNNELSDNTVDNARNDFLEGKAVFYQNGSWEAAFCLEVYNEEEIGMIPIYVGAGDESKQGLCTDSENFLCVNKNASEIDIKGTLDFINWCLSSEEAVNVWVSGYGTLPYKNFPDSTNIFLKQAIELIEEGKEPVLWNFGAMPLGDWNIILAEKLKSYAINQTDSNWNLVVEAFVDQWSYYVNLYN